MRRRYASFGDNVASRSVPGSRRAQLAQWDPPHARADPLDVLAAANARCEPTLRPIRYGRMLHSPLAFLRGAGAIMNSDLAAMPMMDSLVQLSGDCHLLNFGLFVMPDGRIVFDMNHYDQTFRGPWDWDVRRLATSIVLAGRHACVADARTREAAVAAVRRYRQMMWHYAALSPLEVWYDVVDMQHVIDLAPSERARKRRENLERRARHWIVDHVFPQLAKRADGSYRIVDQPPLMFHGDDARRIDRANELLSAYRPSLGDEHCALFDRYQLHDAATNAVGIGTIGLESTVAVHQLRAMPISLPAIDITRSSRLSRYGEFCGWVLARAHANSGDAQSIACSLGSGDTADNALGEFAVAYADQTELDRAALVEAVAGGRVEAVVKD